MLVYNIHIQYITSQECYKNNTQTRFTMAHLLAGAGGAFIDGQEEPGGADLFELSLFTRVEEDHG